MYNPFCILSMLNGVSVCRLNNITSLITVIRNELLTSIVSLKRKQTKMLNEYIIGLVGAT